MKKLFKTAGRAYTPSATNPPKPTKPSAPKPPKGSTNPAVTISVSVKPEMPEKIAQRISALGISRSQYIVMLMIRDLVEAGLIDEQQLNDPLDPEKAKVRAAWFKKLRTKQK